MHLPAGECRNRLAGRRDGTATAPNRDAEIFISVADNSLSGNGSAPPATLRKPRSSAWVRVYSVLLFALFILYYQVVVIALTQLLNLVVWLAYQPRATVVAFAVVGMGIALAVMMVARLAWELWNGVVGLVTHRFDDDENLESDAAIPLSLVTAPELYSLINDVGCRINAPLPDHLRISPRAECYVSEKRRFGLGIKRELTLVLGLPHLSVLSVNELRVIIAHELAHFRGDTQLGVFLYRFLETLRAANERQQHTRTAWIDPVFWFRWVYFHICIYLSAPVFRYQELLADSVSASVHGGELTARTLLREWLLAQQFDALVEAYGQPPGNAARPACENIFHEFSQQFSNFSPAAQDYLRKRLMSAEESSLFDSHPLMRDRFKAVDSYPAQDMPELRRAGDLLPDLASLQLEFHRQLVCC